MRNTIAATLLACSLPAAAGDFPAIGTLPQDRFRALAEDLGAALSYKGVTPATPLGLAGFDIGVEVTATDVKSADAFRRAGSSSPDYIAVPKLHVYKGLPGGFDIGAFIGAASDVNATVYGLDLRYAFLDDGVATPAVAMRLSGTWTQDMGSLKVATYGGDLVVSKKLTLVTPYVGAGVVRTSADAGVNGLADENFNKGRYFGGLNVNLAIVNLAFEAEKLGSNTTLSAKAGWRF